MIVGILVGYGIFAGEPWQPLSWVKEGVCRLPYSHASITVPSTPISHLALIGEDAKRLAALAGHREPSLEAILTNPLSNYTYLFCDQQGYIPLDKMTLLDPFTLLEKISGQVEKDNEERRKNGFAPLHIVQWLQHPRLDPITHTLYWAMEYREERSFLHRFCSVALKLSRFGFEKFVWKASMLDYKTCQGELDLLLRNYRIDPGFQYRDHQQEDPVAQGSFPNEEWFFTF